MLPVRILLNVIQWATTIFVWGIVAGIFVAAWFYVDLPDVDDALEATRQPTIKIFSADGEILASKGDLYGSPTQISDVPDSLVNAILATEDRRFYDHHGLDLVGLLRAVWVNIRAGRIKQGGSTISQQVAKNLFLSPERSMKRKIQELMLAFWLEYKFTKNQILTIYLNRVYFGSGTYGVDAAARLYFGKPVSKISTYQSALLAGLLKAPSRYNPKANKKKAWLRAAQVLDSMVAAGYIAKKDIVQIKKGKATDLNRSWRRTGGHFTDWILGEVASYVSVGNRDIEVITTLNAKLQRNTQSILAHAIKLHGKKKNIRNGAIVIMSPAGAILAMVGGKNYKNSQFNRATQARRQPGSVFKPIVYLSALESGLTPDSIISDSPVDINNWKPKNFDKKYRGNISLKTALSYSVNTVAVKIAKKVGSKKIKKTAKRLGIMSPLSADLSMALGTSELTLLELTSAYASFANGGYGILPYGIEKVRSSSGGILYLREGSGPGRVISTTQVENMKDMLASVLQDGTGRKARLVVPAGGKTGTSQKYRDAWFVGYTSKLVSGVWLGNDNSMPMKNVTGGGLPAHIWKKVMLSAFKLNIKKPDQVVVYNKESLSGTSPGSYKKFNFLKTILNRVHQSLN